MSKPIPLEYGRYYHIYNRGINRENLFFEDRNFRYFLQLYAKHITPIADTFAYCLLYNHFHFVVRIKTAAEQREETNLTGLHQNLTGLQDLSGFTPKKPSQQFSNLFNAYTKAINKGYKRTGSLFERPFDRRQVTSEAYFLHLITYIHQNPQKHGLVADFRTWPYSSYRAIHRQADSKLEVKQALAWFGGPDSFDRHHRAQADERVIKHLLIEDFT